jgi:hypothetical protein
MTYSMLDLLSLDENPFFRQKSNKLPVLDGNRSAENSQFQAILAEDLSGQKCVLKFVQLEGSNSRDFRVVSNNAVLRPTETPKTGNSGGQKWWFLRVFFQVYNFLVFFFGLQ